MNTILTDDEIIKMAKQCGHWSGQTVEMNDVGLEHFAALVAAAELRRLHAEVVENDRNLGDLTDDLIKTVALLRQALEALETDDWQKKMQASIDIKKHLESDT